MKRVLLPLCFMAACLGVSGVPAAAQQAGQLDGHMTENPQYKQLSSPTQTVPANTAPPRSDGESSSESNRVDLSPPKWDSISHPEAGHVADQALKQHEWNPLRAMKDVEVGDFYYRNENYKAALSRYREALEYKPRDAVATFKLALTLEKSKQISEAKLRYQEYLTILKDGPYAAEAKKALERLNKP